jgi:hypothetical protein
MSDNTVILISVLGKALAVIAAIAGAVFLAYNEKPAWGWLIFVAVVLGSYGVRSTPDPQPESAKPSSAKEGA